MAAKQPPRCGHCQLADAVRHGTILKRQLKDGSVFTYSTDAALAHLASVCRCDLFGGAAPDPELVGRIPVPELRRDGQRILKAGVNVAVQLKRAPGTKVHRGHVLEVYADGDVQVKLDGKPELVVVPADEWVRARRGCTQLVTA